VNNHSAAPHIINDDTIELQLTPEELLGLSQAAKAAELPQSDPGPVDVELRSPPKGRPDLGASTFLGGSPTCLGGMACSVVGFLVFSVFVWWSVDHVFGQPPPTAIAVTSRGAEIIRPALPGPPANSQQGTVRVRNLFDAAEVFEFPPGTGMAEGREKVAALLLQRARERRAQWTGARPVENLHAANLRSP
jgi:hypothetical protein